MRIVAPKRLTPTELVSFLRSLEYVFIKGRTDERNFVLDFSKVIKSSLLSTLVIYKVVEYTSIKKRFIDPVIDVGPQKRITDHWQYYGFQELISNYIRDETVSNKDLQQLKIVFEENFFLAPQALLRDEKYSRKAIADIVLPKIQSYYGKNEKAVNMIFTILSEILLNFWEHAVDDTKSVIVASGNQWHIEVACADTGRGIISTLRPSLDSGLSKEQIMALAVEKGVTSKHNSNHMGYGLWTIASFVSLAKGRMHLYSEGVAYINDYGNVSIKKCGYWPGTIIYVNVEIAKAATVIDIPGYLENSALDLKINFI